MSETKANKEVKLSPVRRLLSYYTPYWKLLLGGLLCILGIAIIQAWFVALIRDIVNAADLHDNARLGKTALLIIGVHVIKWILSFGQTYLIQSATQRIAIRFRNEFYTHLQNLSLSYYEHTKVGHLMSRMINDIGLIQGSASQIIHFVSAPVMLIVLSVQIFRMNWKLALVSMIFLPLVAHTIATIGRGSKKLTVQLQIKLADLAAIVQEILSAMRVVKSFGMEDYEVKKFAAENERTFKTAMRFVKRSATMTPTVDLISVGSIALVFWFGGTMVVDNTADVAKDAFTIGALTAFLLALQMIGNSAKEISRINLTYHQTMAGAQRIFEVLDEEPDVKDAANAVELPNINGYIEFKNVSFAYSNNLPVLEDISFIAEPGQQIALVGPSGAGKSTVANLIPRFYDVTSGAILIDGYDVRDVTTKSLRKEIAIVPQETMLFSTSVRENIAYGNMDASYEEIVEAAKSANAHEFISELPDGYNTLVGERGTRLSGGERQRIAIARALLKNPRLLILDEATSSLDMTSESIVQDALEKLMNNRTTIVIAHRLSTIVNADKIIAVEDGRIVESGTHQELLDLKGLYYKLYNKQSRDNQSHVV